MASNNFGNNSFCEEIGSSQFENPNAAMRKFMQGLKAPSCKNDYNTMQPPKPQPGLVLDPSFKDLPQELVLEVNTNSNQNEDPNQKSGAFLKIEELHIEAPLD